MVTVDVVRVVWMATEDPEVWVMVTGHVVTVVYVVRVSVSTGIDVGYPVNSEDDVGTGYPVNNDDVVVFDSETVVEFVPYFTGLAAAMPRKIATIETRLLCILDD